MKRTSRTSRRTSRRSVPAGSPPSLTGGNRSRPSNLSTDVAPLTQAPGGMAAARAPRRAAWLSAVLIWGCICAAPADILAQVQHATVAGTVVGPDGRPVANTVVTLLDPLGDALDRVIASREGRFRLGS